MLLDLWFSNINMYQDHWEGLLKLRLLSPPRRVTEVVNLDGT